MFDTWRDTEKTAKFINNIHLIGEIYCIFASFLFSSVCSSWFRADFCFYGVQFGIWSHLSINIGRRALNHIFLPAAHHYTRQRESVQLRLIKTSSMQLNWIWSSKLTYGHILLIICTTTRKIRCVCVNCKSFSFIGEGFLCWISIVNF